MSKNRSARRFGNPFQLLEFFRRGSPKSPRQSYRRLELESLEERCLLDGTSTISGFVFVDVDNNGIFKTPDEMGLPGIAVTLTPSSGAAVTVTTAGSGAFSFTSVAAGTYELSSGPVPGLLGAGAFFTSPSAPTGSDLVTGISVGDGQSLMQNLGFQGLGPDGINGREFLSDTTSADYPDLAGSPGTGTISTLPTTPSTPSTTPGTTSSGGPTVTNAIANVTVAQDSPPTVIDLAGHFGDSDITTSAVTFNVTDNGQSLPINVTLFDDQAPEMVANFYDYINAGDYNNIFFTRLISGFALQGGGLTEQANGTTGSTLSAVPIGPTVPGESSTAGTSNTVDTLAMALSDFPGTTTTNPNSATNQFFFNLGNNNSSTPPSTNLDAEGFTVFGQVADQTSMNNLNTLVGTGTTIVDAAGGPAVTPTPTGPVATVSPSVNLASVPLTNDSSTTDSNFSADVPAADYLAISNITTDPNRDFLTYSVTSSNPGLVTATLNPTFNEQLSLNYKAGMTGTSTITVTATDHASGLTTDTTFTVTVGGPVVQSVAIAPDHPLTGTDTITTTAALTATPTITDAAGNPITKTSYQWQESTNGGGIFTPIAGATSATLTLPSSVTAGELFDVQVTASDSVGTGATFTSNPATIHTGSSSITLTPPSVSAVTITPDNPTDTTVLTATPTSSDPATFTYQWLHNGVDITTGTGGTDPNLTSATSPTLDLSQLSDVQPGDTFSVQVTPSYGGVTGETFTSSLVYITTSNSNIVLDQPVVTSVAITPDHPTSGTDTITTTTMLTAAPMITDPEGSGAINTANTQYQWLLNGQPLHVASARSATLNLTQLTGITTGDTFSVKVTPSATETVNGSQQVTGLTFTSNPVTVASSTSNSLTLTPPVVNSIAVAPGSTGNTLTATPTSSDPANFTYQWLHNGVPITTTTDPSETTATSATLNLSQLSSVSAGDTFTVQVTPSYGGVTGTARTSNPVYVNSSSPTANPTATVLDQPVVTSVPINLTSLVLTATPATTDPDSSMPTNFTYTYQWLQNGVAIHGATAATLNLAGTQVASLNVGDTFAVQVTPSAPETLTSPSATVSGVTFTSNAVTIKTTSPIALV